MYQTSVCKNTALLFLSALISLMQYNGECNNTNFMCAYWNQERIGYQVKMMKKMLNGRKLQKMCFVVFVGNFFFDI